MKISDNFPIFLEFLFSFYLFSFSFYFFFSFSFFSFTFFLFLLHTAPVRTPATLLLAIYRLASPATVAALPPSDDIGRHVTTATETSLPMRLQPLPGHRTLTIAGLRCHDHHWPPLAIARCYCSVVGLPRGCSCSVGAATAIVAFASLQPASPYLNLSLLSLEPSSLSLDLLLDLSASLFSFQISDLLKRILGQPHTYIYTYIHLTIQFLIKFT